MPIWAVVAGGLYLLACSLAGHAASQKGHGWERGFLASLLLSPIVGLLWVAALPDRPPTPRCTECGEKLLPYCERHRGQ